MDAGTYANWSQQCIEKEGTNSQMNLVFYFRLTSCVIGSGSGQPSPKAINRPSKSSLVKGDLGIWVVLVVTLMKKNFMLDFYCILTVKIEENFGLVDQNMDPSCSSFQ